METGQTDFEPAGTDDPNVEHRRQPRVSLFQEVVCEADGVSARSQAADLSVGGMFIDLTRLPFRAGDEVGVRFALHPGETGLALRAGVLYVQEGIGMGIRFRDLRDEDRQPIAAFVEEVTSKKAQGLPPLRKSARVSVQVPIRVRATHPNGTGFEERTSIVTLSKHGACLVSGNPVDLGMKLYVETASGLEFKSNIVWVGGPATRSEGQVGIQCRGLAQALGFQFP
jgi:hypothetical protein